MGRGSRRRGNINTRKAKEKSSNPTTQMETLAALVFVALHGGRRPRLFGYLKQITKVCMEIGYRKQINTYWKEIGYLIETHDIQLIPHEQDSSVSPTSLTAQLSFGWLSPTIIYLMIMPSIRDLMQNYTFFEYGKCFSQNYGVPLPNSHIQTFTHYCILVFQAIQLLHVLLAIY